MRNAADRLRAASRGVEEERVGERGRVRVRYRSPGEVLWNLAETLNRGWVLAPLRVRAQVGHPVDVEFELPGLGAALRTPGEVLDVLGRGRGGASLSRVGFSALTGPAKAEIDRLLRSYRRPRSRSRRSGAATLAAPARALQH